MTARFEYARSHGGSAGPRGMTVYVHRTVELSEDLTEVTQRTRGQVRVTRKVDYTVAETLVLDLRAAVDLRDALSAAIADIDAAVLAEQQENGS